MPGSSLPDPAEAVRRKQRLDAQRLFRRLEQVHVPDLTVNYTLEQSSVILPGVLVRFGVLAVLFRLNSAKKWHLALQQEFLLEPLRRWLDIRRLAELAERATVDWMPARVFLDTLAWQVAECLAECSLPQPAAVADECRQRIDFVLGEVDLSEAIQRRWLEMPALSEAERAKLEAVRVAEPCERLRALAEAFAEGHFDFVLRLLGCSYSRYGRRPHHPLTTKRS